ncbi:MAG: cell division protein ZapD [Gammaproteobacteria bacterium]|nr:cell division protein ZapD [Gammaproteobacteria bacterium]MDH5660854.1 cell division protein ZapD [Gammaproteobacteria bacterium]
MSDTIFYEQPLNERMRNFLRLEYLFKQTAYTLRGYSVWDSRSTLTSITTILDILNRNDLKTELLKELERQEKTLSALSDIEGVDKKQLNNILKQIETSQHNILNFNGQLGQNIRDHELLNSLRQRSSIVGGTCDFDIPYLHYWLQQPPEYRIEKLEDWLEKLEIISQPISLILDITRESGSPINITAEKGFYQKNIDSNTPVQLIRVGLNRDSQYFPEISAGKQRFSIRFMLPQDDKRPIQSTDDFNFQLICCAI